MVLLSHSYFLQFDIKQYKTAKPYPPLATLYAAAVLKENNIPFKFIDAQFLLPENIIQKLEEANPTIFVLYDDGFNYLTKMCLTNMRDASFKMLQRAKSLGCTTIVSSSDSTDRANLYLENGADYIIKGEGENTILELVNKLINPNIETNFTEINGLIFKENEEIIKTRKRDTIKNLDDLPFPLWEVLDFSPYKNMWLKNHGYVSINLSTTRGCPFHCNWCAKPIYGQQYYTISPNKVVQEIMYLQKKWGIEHIWFSDDIFGLRPNWVEEFYNKINENKVQIKYKIQSRADLLLKGNTIHFLGLSGCNEVWIGAESGSQKILDAMDKGITIQQIENSVALLKSNNINPCLFIQFGYLNETQNDIDDTIKMILKLQPADIGISVSYPLPGTKFYDNVKNILSSKKQNWTDSDELLLMFRGSFSPLFYKNLQRYVHAVFILQKQQLNLKSAIKNYHLFTGLKILLKLIVYRILFLVKSIKLKKSKL